jgi:hypothetical protein
MGIDLCSLIGHTLTPDEVKLFPSMVDSWDGVKQAYIENSCGRNETLNDTLRKVDTPSFWNKYDLPVDELISTNWFATGDNSFRVTLEAYFGSIHIYRHTLNVELSPEHKYANLFRESSRNYILKCNRLIASYLFQKFVVYCPDSAYRTEQIQDWAAYAGHTIEDILTLANNEFGEPPNDLAEGIVNMFFVDFIDRPVASCDDKFFKDIG